MKNIKNKKGVSNWEVVFNDNTSLVMTKIIDESIIYIRDKTTICLNSVGYIDETRDKFLEKEIKKIIQSSHVEGLDNIIFDKTFEYDDMEMVKIVNTGTCDRDSTFYIIFKSKNIKK